MLSINEKSSAGSMLTTIAVVAAVTVFFQSPAVFARRGSVSVSPGGEYSFALELNGRVLPTFNHNGYTYVEGTRGQRYSIRVQNHTAERIEAVVTVDGRDVITGQEGSYYTRRGYVIEAYDSVLIDGFRTSLEGVAAFRFTDKEYSYAAKMGNGTNVGVIGVAVFKEKKQVLRPVHIPRRKFGRNSSKSVRPDASRAPSANEGMSLYDDAAPTKRARRAQGIGTGYGENQYSPANKTSFLRQRSRKPNARLAAYYDDRQGLISRGVLPRPRPYRPNPIAPDPFPLSPDPGFAPPPPSRYHWE